MSEVETMSLLNLGGGGAVEKFDDEMKRVLENILDRNTGEGARSVTLTVVLKPDVNRDICQVGISCKSKLMPVQPFGTSVFIGVDPKVGACAIEPTNAQLGLFGKREAPKVDNLVNFTRPGSVSGDR